MYFDILCEYMIWFKYGIDMLICLDTRKKTEKGRRAQKAGYCLTVAQRRVFISIQTNVIYVVFIHVVIFSNAASSTKESSR
jgi:hypothetical protein